MNHGGHNRKITSEQREEVLRVYLDDARAGEQLSLKHGLCRDYARKLACARGMRPVIVPTGSLRTGAMA